MADHPVALRALSERDVPAAFALSQAVRWPHRLEDWRLLAGFGHGFAAADAAGDLHGVALWWPFGADFATLGLVIVSPRLQKAGIGRRLMQALTAAADGRTIQLNATAEGLRLYEGFGFAPVGGICQHQGVPGPEARSMPGGVVLRPAGTADRPALLRLDAAASGVDRAAMLDTLAAVAEGLVAERGGMVVGYALCRDFGRGRQIGPVVADREDTALALVSALATRTGGFVRVDIPEDAARLATWLEGAGLAKVGHVTTMRHGPARPTTEGRIYGLASQALG